MPTWLLALTSPSLAAELLVPDDYSSVQDAVNAAVDDDIIIVTANRDGRISVDNKRLVINGIGIENVALTSNDNEVIHLSNGAELTLRHLTVDGETSRRGIEVRDASVLTLEGVKIMDGDDRGAGVDLQETSTLVSMGSLFCGNDADGEGFSGGAIRVDDDATVSIFDTVFYGNNADARGGAIRHESSIDGTLQDSTFYLNHARSNGGAIHSNNSDVSIERCIFLDNSADCDECTGYVLDTSGSGSFSGDDNLYFGNTEADADFPLFPNDTTGVDPLLVGSVPSCASVTMADFTAQSGGPADTDGLGAVGVDTDGDGYGIGPDCDLVDDTIHPSAVEAPADGVDQNCDGIELCYVDEDMDGFGDGSTTTWTTDLTCSAPGLANNGDDCDDTDPTRNPTLAEIADDGVDQDCDGVDHCYRDNDDDGFRTDMTFAGNDLDCNDAGEGLASDPAGDCNDDDDTIFPGASDLDGDGIDSNCDGTEVCFVDADNDGYSDIDATVVSADGDCDDPGEGIDSDDDCDDSLASVNPGADEVVGNEVDNDCDGVEACYVDEDADGYAEATGSTVVGSDVDCSDPGEAAANVPRTDCVDDDPTVRPDATEAVGDGVDQDCDGLEACYVDGDGDGFHGDTIVLDADLSCTQPGLADDAIPGGDCNDDDVTVLPGATEVVADGIDQDCDGGDTCYDDDDGDGFSDISGETVQSADLDCLDDGETDNDDLSDCDDEAITTFPGATEQCGDLLDNDCDGSVDEESVFVDWYLDADGDGFGDEGSKAVNDCAAPGPDYVENDLDCDDTIETVNPGFPELPCDGVDNDCNPTTADDDGSCDTGPTDTGPTDTGTAADTDTDTDADSDADADADTDSDVDTDTTGGTLVDEGVPVAEKGCACTSSPSGAGWVALLPMLAFAGRRRASQR